MAKKMGDSNKTTLNSTRHVPTIPGIYDITQEDCNWMMTSAFIIFTMQTGFGLLESGCVSLKNETNIMMKNLVDIFLGGFTYWLFGFATSFGHSTLRNPFIGWGEFALDVPDSDPLMGRIFTAFLFQMSFATTATTIVSGAMAERCNFRAYCVFSFLNTIVYSLPAGWVWSEAGFLNEMGVVDIAGSGPVHLVGGLSAFGSAIMLGPRIGRYDKGTGPLPLGSPVNAVMGLFVLWWGWLAFNSGSTLGVSGAKWQYSARAAVMTLLSSFGGGYAALIYTLIRNRGKVDVIDLINGVLGALVSVTAGCFLYESWEAIVVGIVGATFTCCSMPLMDWIKVDDPVGATAVHGVSGVWGVLAVGIFATNPSGMTTTSGRSGVLHGGGWYLFGVQALSVLCLSTWSFFSTIVLLWVCSGISFLLRKCLFTRQRPIRNTWLIDRFLPIRMDPIEELIGADLVEHGVRHAGVGVSRAISAVQTSLTPNMTAYIAALGLIGINPGHELYIQQHGQQSVSDAIQDAYWKRVTRRVRRGCVGSFREPSATPTATITEVGEFRRTINADKEPNYAWIQ